MRKIFDVNPDSRWNCLEVHEMILLVVVRCFWQSRMSEGFGHKVALVLLAGQTPLPSGSVHEKMLVHQVGQSLRTEGSLHQVGPEGSVHHLRQSMSPEGREMIQHELLGWTLVGWTLIADGVLHNCVLGGSSQRIVTECLHKSLGAKNSISQNGCKSTDVI